MSDSEIEMDDCVDVMENEAASELMETGQEVRPREAGGDASQGREEGGREDREGGAGRLAGREEVRQGREESREDANMSSDSGDLSEEDENSNTPAGSSALTMPERKRKDPAPCWKYAERAVGGATCNICGNLLKLGATHNTTNINLHILGKHGATKEAKQLKKELDSKREVLKKKTVMKAKKEKGSVSIKNWVKTRGHLDPFKKKKLDEALVKMTIGMNRPFMDVDNHWLREVLFIAEPNYICPSPQTHTRNFDEAAKKVQEALKEDIIKDVTKAGHKTINITSDHGKADDRFHTKRNVVTVARTTKDFTIKKDIIKVIKCEGSQTGKVIKSDVKKVLKERAGWQEDWKVNWVTDNESKQKNASDPNNHPEVGMQTFHVRQCVDHTFELANEETLVQCPPTNSSVKKVRSLVNYFKDSTLATEAFYKIMIEAGVDPLAVVKGTDNRWFFKYMEVERALVLKEHINMFFETYDTPHTLSMIEDEDWENLLVYENALKIVVEAATGLEGELYPTASSVIPFLVTITDELSKMSENLKGEGLNFVETLKNNLKSNRRFPNEFRDLSPYNSLTLLDQRYADLYFSKTDLDKAVEDIIIDSVFDDFQADTETLPATEDEGGSHEVVGENIFARKRAELLAKKRSSVPLQLDPTPTTLRAKVKHEVSKFLKQKGTLGITENPNSWWRLYHKDFPLLSTFWKAHSAFPATSTSSERAYSMQGLILTKCR